MTRKQIKNKNQAFRERNTSFPKKMKLVTQVPEKVGGGGEGGETEGCLKEVTKKCIRKSTLCMSNFKKH